MPLNFDLSTLVLWIQEHLVPAGAALLLLALVVRLLFRSRSRAAAPPAPRSGPGPAGDALRERELRRENQQLQEEVAGLKGFFLLLPDLTREINSIRDKRNVAPLLVKMLGQIFNPQKILVFFANEKLKVLRLVEQKGFAARGEVGIGLQVAYGEGRVGWVALNRVTMDSNDFANVSRTDAQAGGQAGKRKELSTDLCAPMVHDKELFGVISVGECAKHPPLEKRMLEMVADFGSVALNNIYQFNQIQAAANSDGLTKLFNKRYFLARFGEDIIKAEKKRSPLSVFIFDLDYFKKYNDTHGHQAGDECLKLVAQVLREAVREDDVAARYGGEEFVVILPGTSREGALQAAEKIREAIGARTFTPPHPVNPDGRVTISGGIATYPDDGKGSADLIRRADEGLYEAKRQGRNRVLVALQPGLSNAAR